MPKLSPGGYPLTSALLRKIEALLEVQGKTWRDLGICPRTWRRWKSPKTLELHNLGCPHLIRPGLFAQLAERLGVSLDDLCRAGFDDFRELERVTAAVDADVMELTRSLVDLPFERVEEAYRNHVTACLLRHNLTVNSFLRLLEALVCEGQIDKTIPPADLQIRVSSGFERIEFESSSGTLVCVDRPLLMWDCHCGTPTARTPSSRCPIHRWKERGDEIAALFSKGLVRITWEGLTIWWRNTDYLWPPSVDTFRMLRLLEKDRVFNRPYDRILDLGSGTGIMGIYAGSRIGRSVEIELADWLLTPALYGMVNFVVNREMFSNARVKARIGMMNHWLGAQESRGGGTCLVLCNPPYLPILSGFEAVGSHCVVASTDLMLDLISHPAGYGDQIFVQYSDASAPEAQRAARQAGARLRRVGTDSLVPFRVVSAWKHSGYLGALVKHGRINIVPRHRHPYWHRLRLRKVEPRTKE